MTKKILILVLSLSGLSFSAQALTCEQLSDRQCRHVWDSKHKGNVVFGEEKVYSGTSTKSELQYTRKLDIEAFLQSEERLPSDLKKALKPLMKELSAHMRTESAGKAWLRHLAVIEYRIRSAAEDVAEERTFQRRPDLKLKGKREEDKTFEDRHELQKDLFEVKSQILEAKYAKHPNWLRVEKTFKEAKDDILRLIEEFPLKPDVKKTMYEKVAGVVLSLPYEDPRKLGAREECGFDQVNAAYYPAKHKFTVCAGYFNGYQSVGKMYETIAHEIAHAIDGGTYAYDFYLKTGLAALMTRLSAEKGKLPCGEWNVLKAKNFREPQKFFELPDKVVRLNECHVDRSRLAPLTLQSLREPSQAISSDRFGSYADYNAFTKLVQPKIYKFEQLIDNEMFMQPERLTASYEQFLFLPNDYGYFDPHMIFIQEFTCDSGKDQDERFRKALDETRRLQGIYLRNRYSFTGRETRELSEFNLARPSYESWADWVGKKAFTEYLKRVPKEKQRDMILAANASECEPAGLNTVAPTLVKIEKQFSNEEHPESRTRRLFLFTDYVADLMSCKKPVFSDQKCEM